ncbi:MAG: hypothetical protein GY842_05875 [bacterium]|nr:hypothetical protein [bacterium]
MPSKVTSVVRIPRCSVRAWRCAVAKAVPLRLIVAGALLALPSTGCSNWRSAPVRITCWAAPDGLYPPPDGDGESNSVFDAGANCIKLSAALNETVAFRLWLTYSGDSVGKVAVEVADWHSGPATLAAEAVRIYRAHSVRISSWPGWHHQTIAPAARRESVEDVLIPAVAPRGGLPWAMSDGDTLSLWVDVQIPKGTRPGTYWSKLRVVSGGEVVTTLDLRLEALGFVLPADPGVVLAADLDHRALFAHHVRFQGAPCRAARIVADSPIRAELEAVLDTAVRMLRDHGISPLLPTLYPTTTVDALNQVKVRWADYDNTVAGYLDGGKFLDRAGLALWRVPFDEQFPVPPNYGAMQSPSYSLHLRQYLAECADHFAERGWIDRSFVELPRGDTPTGEAVRAAEHFGRVVRQADPRLRVLSGLFPQDLGPAGWPDFPALNLDDCVDIWCPAAQFHARSVSEGDAASPRRWMRVDRPPYSGSTALAASVADTRVLAWQAMREGAGVLHVGPANSWPEVTMGLTAQACVAAPAGTTVEVAPLVYPGSIAGLAEPIASARLKRLRRSLQDLSYVRLMKDKGVGHIAEVLSGSLAPYAGSRACRFHYADPRAAGWTRDAQRWIQARQIMISELIGALEADPVAKQPRLAAHLNWRRFIDAVRQVRVTVEGVRVRPASGTGVLGRALVECTVAIHNAKRTAAKGSLSFGPLPVGWRSANGPVEVEVAAGGSGRVVLTAEAAVVTWNDNGVRRLPIELELGDGSVHRISARMSYCAAQTLHKDIRIDGDLTDWPPGMGNLAADFVLVSGEPAERTETSAGRPRLGTRVWALASARALVLAFECGTAEANPALSAHRNVVSYDDLIPLGEESVEVLLDPTGAGTHSPADLFHVVVKPTGAVWELGVGTTPPMGRRRIWAADIRYATRTYPNRWIAEVWIPWEAFGVEGSPRPHAHAERIWGANFARFDAHHQEYSNWAGAVRNVYDPAALGNLSLP